MKIGRSSSQEIKAKELFQTQGKLTLYSKCLADTKTYQTCLIMLTNWNKMMKRETSLKDEKGTNGHEN